MIHAHPHVSCLAVCVILTDLVNKVIDINKKRLVSLRIIGDPQDSNRQIVWQIRFFLCLEGHMT